jgi:hypothetical protein
MVNISLLILAIKDSPSSRWSFIGTSRVRGTSQAIALYPLKHFSLSPPRTQASPEHSRRGSGREINLIL